MIFKQLMREQTVYQNRIGCLLGNYPSGSWGVKMWCWLCIQALYLLVGCYLALELFKIRDMLPLLKLTGHGRREKWQLTWSKVPAANSQHPEVTRAPAGSHFGSNLHPQLSKGQRLTFQLPQHNRSLVIFTCRAKWCKNLKAIKLQSQKEIWKRDSALFHQKSSLFLRLISWMRNKTRAKNGGGSRSHCDLESHFIASAKSF